MEFIKLTERYKGEVYINIEKVTTFYKDGDYTTIRLNCNTILCIKETPEEILKKLR